MAAAGSYSLHCKGKAQIVKEN
ncbi:hypothetical protein CCACVL1_02603 [Corchorus capsularis]|uniref:Uncharacterized protein n=1 Tax=Corchorus capsularis TaxID=210143 RepID=A0A1R3K7Q1_COCAP|nr:hypothetical protein CCACVL1_02603 [Corchorus capsularis]